MSDVLDDERYEAVCDALATGLSARAVARQFSMQEREVRAVLTEEARRCFDGERLREHVALEVRRVRAASLKYFNKGMELRDGELATGIYFKGVERLMYILGANAPQQYAVHLMNQAPPEDNRTSTAKMLDAIRTMTGETPRETELEDRWRHQNDRSPELVEELNTLRAARGEDSIEQEYEREQRRQAARGGR
jgi:hypothetical protein